MSQRKSRKLTPKQQRFLEAYLKDPNATAAYKAAGYKARSDQVAATEGARLLQHAGIAAAIAAANAVRTAKANLDAYEVIRRLDRESRRRGRGSSHAARVQALKLLGLHLGMFPKKVHLGGPDGGPLTLTAQDLSDDAIARIILEHRRAGGGDAGASPGSPAS